MTKRNFERRISALPPPPRPIETFSRPVSSPVLEELRRTAREEPGLRTDAEVVALIEAERAGWGKRRTPAERVVLDQLARMAGAPLASASTSADQHAVKFADWLRDSDRRLAGEAGRMKPPADREEAGSGDVDGGEGHTP